MTALVRARQRLEPAHGVSSGDEAITGNSSPESSVHVVAIHHEAPKQAHAHGVIKLASQLECFRPEVRVRKERGSDTHARTRKISQRNERPGGIPRPIPEDQYRQYP